MVSEICKQYNIYGTILDPVWDTLSVRLIDKDGCAYGFAPREVKVFNKCFRIFNKLGIIA